MKIKKVLGALAVLLALTVVGCSSATNNPSGNSGSQTSSVLPSIKITVEGNKRTLEVDETVQLSADVEDVTWESSVATVATVDNQGLVTAVAAGTATIKAAISESLYAECEVTVTPAQGGGEQGNNLTEAIVLDYSGLTLKGSEIAAADALAKIGQGNAHVTAVTSSKIYDGNGSGGAYPNTAGMLKSGTSSVAGQINLTLDANANKVEILCHDFYKKDADHQTNSNTFAVNGSDAVLAPYNETAEFGTLTFNLAEAAKEITIDINKRAYIKQITISYSSGETPVEIAQPVGNFSGYATSAADGSNVFVTVALGQEAAFVEVGSLFKTTTTYTFNKATGLVTINLDTYGVFTATYDEANNKLVNGGIEGAAAAYIGNNNAIELAGAAKFYDCDGTTEQLQATFLRRYMSGSWQEDQTNADRLVSYENGIAGSALQRRGWTGGAVALNAATNFEGGLEVSNIGFWVYNPGASDVSLRQWVYKADNRFGDPKVEIGNVTAVAGQWTYCRMGFTKATIYNFQVADFNNSGIALVFDNIALF